MHSPGSPEHSFLCVLAPGSSKEQVTLETRMKVPLRSVAAVINGFRRDQPAAFFGKESCMAPLCTKDNRYLLAVSVYSFLLLNFS